MIIDFDDFFWTEHMKGLLKNKELINKLKPQNDFPQFTDAKKRLVKRKQVTVF